MKQYLIPKIVLVFFSTVVIVSCHKETESLSTAVNNGTTSSLSANNIFTDSSLINGTDQVFYFHKASTAPISCSNTYCTVRSRYIFKKDGSFILQFDHDGENKYSSVLQYKGHYKQSNNSISFTWEAWSVAGSWGATGTLRGEELTIEYNTVMMLTDFEDAVYLRKR